MNIINVLQLLTEGKNPISEIREKVGDKVPESVLNTLASLMKDDYYDKTAMAIIKKIQEWEGDDRDVGRENLDFLKKKPKLVYAALKEAGKGSPKYDPEMDLTRFRFNANFSPMKWWAEYRSDEKKFKETNKGKKKEVLGLKGVEPIKLQHSYLFIPRSFKFENDYGFNGLRISDLGKQQEELKSLSMSMARKDDSGEVNNGNKATENHWCVASDNPDWFKGGTYKGGHLKGVFVIIVNKNKDGSPNWNDRYLYWNNGHGIVEVADKFNRHDKHYIHVPQDTVDFIENKIVKNLKYPKGDIQYSELKNRVNKAKDLDYEYTKKGTRKINRDSKTIKNYFKILKFLRSAYQQDSSNNENEDPKVLIWRAIRKFVEGGGVKIPPIRTKYYVVKAEPQWLYQEHQFKNDGRFTIKAWKASSEEEAGKRWGYSDLNFSIPLDEAREIKADINKLEPILKKKGQSVWQSYQNLKPSFKSKANILYDSTPPKGVADVLKNNKYAMNMYDGDKMMDAFEDDEIKEFFIGPYFSITVQQGQNLVYVSPTPWKLDDEDGAVRVGELSDSDILEKVKAAYDKYVKGKVDEHK